MKADPDQTPDPSDPDGAGARRAARDLDCETAALLRATIRPLFETSPSWDRLMDSLRERGYRLTFQDGRLCVIARDSGVRVCGLRFLGYEMRELVARMGRPVVIAWPGGNGALIRTPPARP